MYGPHDLLRVDPSQLQADGEVPGWARAALLQHPWVVVRREAASSSQHLSVGVRGALRSQRFAMRMPATAALECLHPWALQRAVDEGFHRSPLPAMAALPALAALLQGWRWGPGGSIAFHLATGAACVHADSDLDLLLYPSVTLSRKIASELLRAIQKCIKSADVLIESPEGAYALAEYAEGRPTIVCRTPQGPVLARHPDGEVARSSLAVKCQLRMEPE